MRDLISAEIPGVNFNGPSDPDKSLYTVLNVSLPPNSAGDMLLFKLDIEGVCASGGSACSSGASKGSHVLAAIHHPDNRTGVRFSFGKYTTEDEIRFGVEKLKKVIQE